MAIIYNCDNNACGDRNTLSPISRILQLMHKYVIENRRNMLMIAGCYLAILIISGILGAFTSEFSTRSAILFITVLCGGALLAITASLLFNDMAHKDSRISVIMTPASASQKFLARLLVVFPCTILLIVIGYYALGYSSAIATYALYDIWSPKMQLGDIPYIADPAWIFLVSMLILEYAFYLFGSVAWPRYSFLKSCGILWGTSVALSILALYIIKQTGLMHWEKISQEVLIWCLDAVMLLTSCAFIWASIYLLRHKTPAK